MNGGTLTRSNVSQLYVAMGLDVESGQVNVSNPLGQTTGNPLHFTGTTGEGPGLFSQGGQMTLNGDLMVDKGGEFVNGANVTVASNATLTLGVNANSALNYLETSGGTFILQGTLVPHGGFTIYSGLFATGGGVKGAVNLDSGNQFVMNGGSLDVSNVAGKSAAGKLFIDGEFDANGGQVVINVDTTGGQGKYVSGNLSVGGNAEATTNAIFVTGDLNGNPGNVNTDWDLMDVSGSEVVNFTFRLPPNWSKFWLTLANGPSQLMVHEP